MNQTTDVSKVVMESLLELIVSREFESGNKLPSERELASTMQVSRASIREALSALALMGIVESRHGGGTYVSTFQVAPLIQKMARLIEKNAQKKELWDVRRMLEREAIHLLCKHEDSKEMRDDFERVLQRMYQDTLEASIEGNDLDLEFHQLLFYYSGNTILRLFADGIQEILRNLVAYNRTIILSRKDNALVLYQQHRSLADAIFARDEIKAIRLLGKHLDFVLHHEDIQSSDLLCGSETVSK